MSGATNLLNELLNRGECVGELHSNVLAALAADEGDLIEYIS
jgi:hypothetical protein